MAEENQVMKEPQQVTKEPQRVTTKDPKKIKLVRGWLQSIVKREKRRREKNKCNWKE